MSKERIGQLLDKAQRIKTELKQESEIINKAKYEMNQKLNELIEIQCSLIVMDNNYDSTGEGQTR